MATGSDQSGRTVIKGRSSADTTPGAPTLAHGVDVDATSLAAQNSGSDPILLDAGGAAQITIPGGSFLIDADYVREGPDLLLIGSDGQQVLIRDFFASETPPDLISDSGLRIDGDLAARLAGPNHRFSTRKHKTVPWRHNRSAGSRRSKGA